MRCRSEKLKQKQGPRRTSILAWPEVSASYIDSAECSCPREFVTKLPRPITTTTLLRRPIDQPLLLIVAWHASKRVAINRESCRCSCEPTCFQPKVPGQAWPIAFSPWRESGFASRAPVSPRLEKGSAGAGGHLGTMAGWDGRRWVRATGPVRRPSYVRREPAARCREVTTILPHLLRSATARTTFFFSSKIGSAREINYHPVHHLPLYTFAL